MKYEETYYASVFRVSVFIASNIPGPKGQHSCMSYLISINTYKGPRGHASGHFAKLLKRDFRECPAP